MTCPWQALRNSLIFKSTQFDMVFLLSGMEECYVPSHIHWIGWLGMLAFLDILQGVASVRLEFVSMLEEWDGAGWGGSE